VCSATAQRGGNTTKSATAVPGFKDGHVRTVNIDGSFPECVKNKINNCRKHKQSIYCMIERDRVNDHEIFQIIFIRRVVPMPTDYVEARMVL
jgi:hypothetical protein